MCLSDYCSNYINEIYGICGCFDGKYVNDYFYSINDESNIPIISNIIKNIKPQDEDLLVDSGLVIDFKYKEHEGYVVVQSIYNDKESNLSNILRMIANYIGRLKDMGMKEVIITDNYADYKSTLYSFDIAFILDKANVEKIKNNGKQ